MSEYVTVSEAAEILQVSRPYVYKLIQQGTLPAEKRPLPHASIRIKRADAEKLAAELAYKPFTPK